MKELLPIGVAKQCVVTLLMSLLTVGQAGGDIVDGIWSLGDSIALWQTTPPAWALTTAADDWDEVERDTLDARGDSVLIQYPALYEDQFVSSYVEVRQAGQKQYFIPSAWQDSVWVVSGQAVGSGDEGWRDSTLQDYFRARLLQLRLLLHAHLEKVKVPLLADTISVAFTLVGRDIQHFSLSHDAALNIVRHISGGAQSHAFFVLCRENGEQKVVQWTVFIRSVGASWQHVLIVEDRLGTTAGLFLVEDVAMRFLPGVRVDNVVDMMASDTSTVSLNQYRWRVEIREESD